MRDVHLQTPQNDHSLANRKSKSIHHHSKKALKNSRKNLNSEFSAFVEVAELPELPKDFSLISEAVDDYQFGESTEKFVFPLLPEASTSSENGVLSDLTSVSSGIASEMATASTYQCQNAEAKTCIDTEIAIKHLRQIMNSAITDVVMQELCGLPEKKKCSSDSSLILKKCLLVLSLTLLLCILAVLCGSLSLFSSSGTQPFLGPLPT